MIMASRESFTMMSFMVYTVPERITMESEDGRALARMKTDRSTFKMLSGELLEKSL